jgi:hypothetical protein
MKEATEKSPLRDTVLDNGKKTKLSSIQEGEYLSLTNYFKVKSKQGETLIVEDIHGQEIKIHGKSLIESLSSASQYVETRKASKHEMVEALKSARDKVCTVVFIKQNGDERTIICHVIGHETNLGRTQVIDLEITDNKNNIRQIDNRTIKMVTVDGLRLLEQ